MNSYVTASTIKKLREKNNLTQSELAKKLSVSDKAVSRWETGRGLPDISLIEPLASALGISIIELFSGEHIINKNRSANILHSCFYVCPICGNIVHSTGKSVISCCGVTLPSLEIENPNESHSIEVTPIEDEYFIRINHEMSKKHYISFIAYVTSDRTEIVKLYPEGNPEARFRLHGTGIIYYYCNRDGLFSMKFPNRI